MDRLHDLFDAQLKLIHRILPVYSANGFDEWTRAPKLDSRIHQVHVKYVAWCFIEEIIEAEDADGPKVHEEVVDALHFILELMIFCDMGTDDLFRYTMKSIGVNPAPSLDRLDYLFFMSSCNSPGLVDHHSPLSRLTVALGRAMYLLKQKPWRITDRPTNVEELKCSLGVLFHAFIIYAQSKGLTAKSLWLGYADKNQINHNRVKEKY